MTRQTKFKIFATLALLLAGLIVYVAVFNYDSLLKFLGLYKDNEKGQVIETGTLPLPLPTASDVPTGDSEEVRRVTADIRNLPDEIAPAEIRDVGKDEFIRMAESFAERFGSYSNHSNFSNLSDLKLFMSVKMQKWTDGFIAQNQIRETTDDYYGITTRSIASDIIDWNEAEGSGEIIVHTRRREVLGTETGAEEIFSQNIRIILIKENGAWKVDSAFWQN